MVRTAKNPDALDETEFQAQLKKKYRDDRASDYANERETVWKSVRYISGLISDTYQINDVLAVGGTGIVLTGRHKRFGQKVVLKINRPNSEVEGKTMVANEAAILPSLHHPNIIGVLDLGTVCVHDDGLCACEKYRGESCAHTKTLEKAPKAKKDKSKATEGDVCDDAKKVTYVIEPFIDGSQPLFTYDPTGVENTWLYREVAELKLALPAALELGRGDDSGQAAALVNTLLDKVAKVFSQWLRVLREIHSSNYIYLDVKPENVLVDLHMHLTGIDFGSIEIIRPDDKTPISVFFTYRYAHPRLRESTKETPSVNRVRGGLKRSDLVPAFDLYALGISLLEVLDEIAKVRPHAIPQMPLYRSLHFLATRLLDGENEDKAEKNEYQYASQVFPGLRRDDYKNLRYVEIDDAIRDIRKERGRWDLEEEVPELATYSKDIIRVVPGFNTVFTPRLRGVVEHPLVARLKYVSQLGLVSLVYPTADHARYDHSLGSYTYTTYYVKSLFNDLGNPIFRNLVGAEDINAVLLAALLHDLGQYPLAHDLEEVHKGIFKHGDIGSLLLEDTTQDSRGRTLNQIITDPINGWGVDIESLKRMYAAYSTTELLEAEYRDVTFKTSVLAAIIDGQIDADKADYIIRDSARCGLPYGTQLDMERLLRVLTVAVLPNADDRRRVALGVYDKGLVSAHAFGQARYQLLATVYWHHTSRIVKAMLQYATAMALPDDVFDHRPLKRDERVRQVREQLIAFIKSLVPPFAIPAMEPESKSEEELDLSAKPTEKVMDLLVDEEAVDDTVDFGSDWYPGIAWTDWLMLRWIAELPDGTEQSAHLIHGIQTRNLYKRVITLHHEEHDTIYTKLVELSWPERVGLAFKLHDHIVEKLHKSWGNLDTATNLTETDFDKLAKAHLLMIVDIPSAGRKIGYDRPLGVVPELRQKSTQQETLNAHEDAAWHEVMRTMIQDIAPIRVLCHPDIRNLVTSLYTPLDIEKLLTSLLS